MYKYLAINKMQIYFYPLLLPEMYPFGLANVPLGVHVPLVGNPWSCSILKNLND